MMLALEVWRQTDTYDELMEIENYVKFLINELKWSQDDIELVRQIDAQMLNGNFVAHKVFIKKAKEFEI